MHGSSEGMRFMIAARSNAVAVIRGVARQLLRRLTVEEEGGMVGWQEGR